MRTGSSLPCSRIHFKNDNPSFPAARRPTAANPVARASAPRGRLPPNPLPRSDTLLRAPCAARIWLPVHHPQLISFSWVLFLASLTLLLFWFLDWQRHLESRAIAVFHWALPI